VSAVIDPALEQAMASLALPGIVIGHRVIQPGDESVLLETEIITITSPALEKRRASGAARIVGRQLLSQLGVAEAAIPKRVSGAPLWPDGVTGSFAHDSIVAVAAAALRKTIGAIGIDVEPATMLPDEMFELVTTPRERSQIAADPYRGRLFFAAKEAVYKTVHPLDGQFLDYPDIEIDLSMQKAVTKTGRTLDIRFCLSTHIVVVAWIAPTLR
jgi:4'-phosphopantetheinyl transferase EntD